MRAELFAYEYAIDLNGEQAAIRAGYSPKTARVQASRLLTRANVQEILAKLKEKQLGKLSHKAEDVLRELELMGFANMLDYIGVQSGGMAFVDLSKLTREQAAAIQEITTEQFTIQGEKEDEEDRVVTKVKFKLSDKRGSLELLGKHHKLFNERLDIGNQDGKPFEIVIRNVGPKLRPEPAGGDGPPAQAGTTQVVRRGKQ